MLILFSAALFGFGVLVFNLGVAVWLIGLAIRIALRLFQLALLIALAISAARAEPRFPVSVTLQYQPLCLSSRRAYSTAPMSVNSSLP
jgi:hypothetical protein